MAAAAATAAAAALPPAPAGAGGGGRLPQYAASMPADRLKLRSTAGDGADPISDGAAAPPATGDSLSSSGSAGSVKPTWRDTATAAAAAARRAAADAAANTRRTARRYLLVSHNVNGLGFQNKRRVLLARLNTLGCDVAALQETHTPDDATAAAWLRDGTSAGRTWGGRAFWAHGTRGSRGVAILLGPGLAGVDASTEYTDDAGRDGDDATVVADSGRVLRVGWPDPLTGQHWSAISAA
ncbi:MAG: hypothetical protein J3K34DRAFT_476551 [Monoraphidium minutum]|nr:MAG: hypothetical protein J3K34DRAFT_476551 [Monoraphidium minutum]